MVLYTPSIPGKYLYALSNSSILVNRHTHCGICGNLRMVDLVWIIAGIFVSAVAIALVLGHIHGTLAI